MSSLDSPLEALVFDSTTLSFFVNNLWTWIAVLTAAVSLWRFRSAGTTPIKSDPPPSHSQARNTTATTIGGESPSPTTSSCSSPLSCPVESTASIPPPGSGSDGCGPSTSGSSNRDDGMTKGKFTVVYYGDEEEAEERGDDGGLVEVEWGGGVARGWGRDQESQVVNLVRMGDQESQVVNMVRMGDMGWYKYQDLKVLDGSVVRLWEEERDRNLLLHRRQRYSSSSPSASQVAAPATTRLRLTGVVS